MPKCAQPNRIRYETLCTLLRAADHGVRNLTEYATKPCRVADVRGGFPTSAKSVSSASIRDSEIDTYGSIFSKPHRYLQRLRCQSQKGAENDTKNTRQHPNPHPLRDRFDEPLNPLRHKHLTIYRKYTSQMKISEQRFLTEFDWKSTSAPIFEYEMRKLTELTAEERAFPISQD